MPSIAPFSYSVRGQVGSIPSLGLGTATLFGDVCTAAVLSAIRMGYRHIDTALLYNNQAAVGAAIKEAIASGIVTRQDLFVTTKVAFYPSNATGTGHFTPICFNSNNVKGREGAGIAECLSLLGVDYVDLLLIHNPLTALDEYAASAAPHAFELSKSILTQDERALILARRLAAVRYDGKAAKAARRASWAALEAAHAAGQAKAIGVSNYPFQLIKEMDDYARIMPAVNQLELHPRFSSPGLRAYAREVGMLLTAYGSGNSVVIEKNPVVAKIAERRGVSPFAVVQLWTLAHGVVLIPRSASPAHQAANLEVACANTPQLDAADIVALDALDEAHPYYWWPQPCLPPGASPDGGSARA